MVEEEGGGEGEVACVVIEGLAKKNPRACLILIIIFIYPYPPHALVLLFPNPPSPSPSLSSPHKTQ